MPTACFLSPHLDDAAFSAGGTMAVLRDVGWRVTLATVFTRSVPHPTGFALACQTDKGLPADADYLALRRAEDAAAAAALGLATADVSWLDLPEAPHRGYTSAGDLFAGVHADDATTEQSVATVCRPPVAEADVVFTAAAIGNHVDHLHVLAAVHALATAAVKPLVLWHDMPYVLRLPEPPPADFACDITAGLARKLDACAAYVTQLGFQFGGVSTMRDRLSAAARHRDHSVPVESFIGPTSAFAGLPFVVEF